MIMKKLASGGKRIKAQMLTVVALTQILVMEKQRILTTSTNRTMLLRPVLRPKRFPKLVLQLESTNVLWKVARKCFESKKSGMGISEKFTKVRFFT